MNCNEDDGLMFCFREYCRWTRFLPKNAVLAMLGVFCCCQTYAYAADIPAASCNWEDVQAAVNATQNGDVVIVPAGTCTWSQTVRITDKSITLRGMGMTRTLIDDQTTGGFEKQALIIHAGATHFVRITGIGFTEHNLPPQEYNGIILVKGGTEFRIDHLSFSEVDVRCICIDYGRGVIDHNQFLKMQGPGIMLNYKYTTGGDSFGDYSWSQPTSLGAYTDGMVFIEDNVFAWDEALRNSGEHHDSCIDNGFGARWVFRHNQATDMAIMTHGINGGGRGRGLRQFELYSNTFLSIAESNRNGGIYGMLLRGGTGVAFDNVLTGPLWQLFVKMNLDMEGEGQYEYPMAIAAWGENLGTGANPYDAPSGYPSLDQVGASQDDGIWSGNPASPQIYNNQQLEPVYYWDNTFPQAAVSSESTSAKIQINRDYFEGINKPGYKPYRYPHPLVGTNESDE